MIRRTLCKTPKLLYPLDKIYCFQTNLHSTRHTSATSHSNKYMLFHASHSASAESRCPCHVLAIFRCPTMSSTRRETCHKPCFGSVRLIPNPHSSGTCNSNYQTGSRESRKDDHICPTHWTSETISKLVITFPF